MPNQIISTCLNIYSVCKITDRYRVRELEFLAHPARAQTDSLLATYPAMHILLAEAPVFLSSYDVHMRPVGYIYLYVYDRCLEAIRIADIGIHPDIPAAPVTKRLRQAVTRKLTTALRLAPPVGCRMKTRLID